MAIITVDGTDIEEYYTFDEPLEKEEIRQIWLDDVRDNKKLAGMGSYIAKLFADKVEVKQLWKTHSEQQEKDKTEKHQSRQLEEEDEETST